MQLVVGPAAYYSEGGATAPEEGHRLLPLKLYTVVGWRSPIRKASKPWGNTLRGNNENCSVILSKETTWGT